MDTANFFGGLQVGRCCQSPADPRYAFLYIFMYLYVFPPVAVPLAETDYEDFLKFHGRDAGSWQSLTE